MTRPNAAPITELLRLVRLGDRSAQETLFRSLLSELRRLAAAQMRQERPDHTLQPTALVNEAYVRMSGSDELDYQSRAHFLSAAARVMHNILIDHARSRNAGKRFGGQYRIELGDYLPSQTSAWTEHLLSFEAKLEQLQKFDPRGAQVVELKVFAGMTDDEVAQVLQVSPRTVKRDYQAARLWLTAQLSPAAPANTLAIGAAASAGSGYAAPGPSGEGANP